jgi:Fuc2NAc and GlcNAc transferase
VPEHLPEGISATQTGNLGCETEWQDAVREIDVVIHFAARVHVMNDTEGDPLAAAACGFLAWNFPPARIFMGDAGSGFIGLALALFSLQAGWHQPTLSWAWLVLLGVFVVDATTTLIRRLLRGEKVYEAHRSHANQFAARKYGRHLPVTARVAAINLGWLLPFATAVTLEAIDGFVWLMLAYLPLIALALKFRAGTPE